MNIMLDHIEETVFPYMIGIDPTFDPSMSIPYIPKHIKRTKRGPRMKDKIAARRKAAQEAIK